MGLRLSFGVGPLRASIPLTSRRRRRRRRRSSSAPRGWQGTGEALTPDGSQVRFQCGHHHRSQSAALECVAKRRAQIERGVNLHLVTRVLDSPELRQQRAEREEQKTRRQQERQEAARGRAMRQEAARQARVERQQAARQEREQRQVARQAQAERQQAATQQTRQTRAERTDARRVAASQLAVERRARRAARPPLGWHGWGNISAAAAMVAGIVLAGVAGSNSKSPLAVIGALLVVVAVGTAAVCVPVGLWRKFQARRRARQGTEGVSDADW